VVGIGVLRDAFVKLGGLLPERAVSKVGTGAGYLEIGAWLRSVDGVPRLMRDKEEMFNEILTRIKGARPLYLEFGVYEGQSLRWFSDHLKLPGASFVGFDSFKGLPADWQPGWSRGAFATDGPPQIADDRVSFVIGWFEDTLPTFDVCEHDQLIVNVDCDLFSSAITVMKWLEPYLVPGTLIFFDEFVEEMPALRESLSRTGCTVTPLGRSRGGSHWLFEVSP
jgi:hypothetical protein